MSSLPTYDFCGVVSTADQTNATYLPLDSLHANVFIADVCARVVLSQVYSHEGQDILPEAYYVFPVPARAAVCSFEMHTRNGDRLKGVVKELSQAKEDYEEARRRGWLTGLLEQFRQDGRTLLYTYTLLFMPEDMPHMCAVLKAPLSLMLSFILVFVVSIGTMPPGTDVTVTLSYVVDLSEDDQINTVRFQLSSHVGARYGASANSALYHGTAHRARLSIIIDVNMPVPILAITSLNHPLRDISPSNDKNSSLKEYISSDASLQKYFLLIVHADGLNKPRCFAEHLSSEKSSLHSRVGPTTALALSIVPRFDSRAPMAQEYIFLIDRSGSMSGTSIHMAKQTLILLLRSLPPTDTWFNIFSFGSSFSSLWSASQLYSTDSSLLQATTHVTTMDADMGGTELYDALSNAFRSRNREISTSVFVLTDGFRMKICNVEETVDCVRRAVASAQSSAPLRVFALGIGHGASTELCERLASTGNGSHLMTLDGEDLTLKAIRLVQAMQTPNVKSCVVDWGVASQIEVQQAPRRIPSFSPNINILLTAIIPGELIPTQVTLRLRLSDESCHDHVVRVQPLSHRIPSRFAGTTGDMKFPPLLHTLSAHRLIQDVEGGDAQPTGTPERYIVDLGTRYQVVSRYTAFVAAVVPRPKDPPSRHRGSSSVRSGGGTNLLHGSRSTQGSGPSRNGSNKGGDGRTRTGNCTNSVAGGAPKLSKPSSKSPQTTHRSSTNSETSNSNGNSKPGSKSSNPPRGSQSVSSTSTSSHSSSTPSGRNGSKTPSNSPTTPSDTTPKIPGGFNLSRSSEENGTNLLQGLYDFFTHVPSQNPVVEVLSIPNPLGSDHPPDTFIAPPLPHHTTVTMIASSWLRSLRSYVFPRRHGLADSTNANTSGFAMVTKPSEALPPDIVKIAQLRSANGSFLLSDNLSSIIKIPLSDLRSALPRSLPSTAGNISEEVWASAIAVAFFRRKFPCHSAMWGDVASYAISFGSGACGSEEVFEDVVQEAAKLF
ncbi:hypothetical protein K439DRAFT_1620948 [Ramaria rubella]|nr:hypothetical protein K439DRAFT_1620948 [Ramaria rubella]